MSEPRYYDSKGNATNAAVLCRQSPGATCELVRLQRERDEVRECLREAVGLLRLALTWPKGHADTIRAFLASHPEVKP